MNRLLFFLLFPCLSFSQDSIPTSLHGTIIIGAVCTDGIVICADSRITAGVNIDGKNIKVAYLDGLKKIFSIDKYAIAFSGNIYFGNRFVSELLIDFKATKPKYTDPLSLANCLKKFLEIKYPEYYHLLTYGDEKIICGGYYKGKPQLVLISKIPTLVQEQTGIVASVYTNSTLAHIQQNFGDATAQRLSKIIPEAINIYRKDTNNIEVGGSIAVLKIAPNNLHQWVNGKNFKYWNYLTDYIKDYFDKKVTLIFLRPIYKDLLEESYRRTLKQYPTYSK